jgi:two-component system C4-dicarboxylate transport response regulator DctD
VTCQILIVDDHAELADNVAEILADRGFTTLVAFSAEDALELAEGRCVSAVLTDYRLPGRSGLDLVSELRRRGQVAPAVMMSAFADEPVLEEARRRGVMDVLQKPLDLGQLLRWMEEAHTRSQE